MGEVLFEPWRPGMTYAEEEAFFKKLLTDIDAFDRKEQRKIFREKDTVAWRPEYDDMVMSWWTPKEIKQFEEEGKTKKEIVDLAEEDMFPHAFVNNKGRYYKSSFNLDELDSEAAYRSGTYAKNRVREVVGVLYVKSLHRHCSPLEWGYADIVAEEERIERIREKNIAAREANALRDTLKDSPVGKQSSDELNKSGYEIKFDTLGTTACAVNPEKKTITLNKVASKESQALSLVHAASVLRQRNSGSVLVAENESSEEEVQALRKADALSAQLVFAEEMQQKNPKILETFIKNGNQPMYDAFKLTMAEKNNMNAARSAAVDCYLNAALPDKKLWPSTISKICKGFDNQSYYVAPDDRTKTVSDTLFNEPAFNAVFAAKAKQGGR